jgi:hypothetical protein
MKVSSHHIAIGVALGTIFASVVPAATQSSKPPRDPAGIQRKVQRSAELQRQALQGLNDAPQAEKVVWNAFNQLKSAYDDMVVNATNARTPDPMLGLNSRKAEQALSLVQQAGDALQARGDNAVEVARDRLQQSLRLTNTLLATGF